MPFLEAGGSSEEMPRFSQPQAEISARLSVPASSPHLQTWTCIMSVTYLPIGTVALPWQMSCKVVNSSCSWMVGYHARAWIDHYK